MYIIFYLSIYLSYLYSTSPQIFTSYHKCFTIFTCARPFSVSFLCEKEPPPPRSTPWGAYRCHGSCVQIFASARQPGETHNVSAFALVHLLQLGRSMVVGHVLMVHTCSFMCTNHIDMIAHTPVIWTSIMQAEDGRHFCIFFLKLFPDQIRTRDLTFGKQVP